MGAEIQTKIVNNMLNNAADDMRLITAKLIPYLMMKGCNIDDICKFNSFVDKMAGIIESHVMKDSKIGFTSLLVLDDYMYDFLFNLGSYMSREFPDPTIDPENEQQPSFNSDNSHIIPINSTPLVQSTKSLLAMLHPDQATTFVEMFCKRYSEVANKPNVIKSKTDTLENIAKIWRNNNKTMFDKGITIFEKLIEFIKVLKSEYEKHVIDNKDTDEFL